ITDFINHLLGTNYIAIDYLAWFSNQTLQTQFDFTHIILPVGISFYVFQTLSYTIDVYRGKLPALRNIIDFALFVSFFPQLVAGPIVRAVDFIPQIHQPYYLSEQDFGKAIFLIIKGLTKKLIADYLGVNLVGRVFENPFGYSGFETLLGIYGFSIQIYFDFSGYTDIAIALSLLLGFKLPLNFNEPYKASNITDFWRRWHISLSSWLKDYLYISLGGNKSASWFTYLSLLFLIIIALLIDKAFSSIHLVFLLAFSTSWLLWLRQYKAIWAFIGLHFLALEGGLLYTQMAWYSLFLLSFIFVMWFSAIWSERRRLNLSTDANLMLTMVLGGLWHGGHLRFLIWGALHGLALGLHKSWLLATKNNQFFRNNKIYIFFAKIITFHFICMTWVFFRANSISLNAEQNLDATQVAFLMFEKIFFYFQPKLIFVVLVAYWKLYLVLLIAFLLHFIPLRLKEKGESFFIKMSDIGKAFLIVFWIIFVFFQMRSSDIQQFIYFQF
ncbi:MAG: MBOAT family O-acyltransferase, partial [Thermonemataceae bacterium]|nr:MBOAT family O-acyltransferase [Thermonemataceae bacterium]